MITGIFTEWALDDFCGFTHENLSAKLYGKPGQRLGVTSIPDIARHTINLLRLPLRGQAGL